MAIGILVAFSPTVGIQIPLAFLLATAFRANRLAALTPIWTTNVFTLPAFYGFTYRIGNLFLPGREPGKVRRLLAGIRDELMADGIPEPGRAVRLFSRLGVDLLVPMLIGGLVVGLAAAAVAYPLTLRIARRSRERRSRRLERRAAERRAGSGRGVDANASNGIAHHVAGLTCRLPHRRAAIEIRERMS